MRKEKSMKLILTAGLLVMACSAWMPFHVRAEGTNQELNYMPLDSYKEFGLPVSQNAPDDFKDDTEDPLKGFEAGSYSRLYLGVMNKNNKLRGQGSFKVMETAANLDAQNKNITISNPDKGQDGNLDKKLRGQEIFYQDYNDKSKAYQTQNVIAVDRGRTADEAPLAAAFVENVLYRGDVTINGKTKSANRQRIRLYVPDAGGNYQDKDTVDRALANKDSLTADGFKDIKAEGKNGLLAMASGDYDNDGVKEVAVYVPDTGCVSGTYSSQARIEIFKINGDKLSSWRTINLKDISGGLDFAYKSWYVPVVSLSTTGISGQDDLVVTASLPLRKSDSYGNQNQDSVLAVYRFEGDSPKKLYSDSLNYGSYRMRYASAADADINGNTTKELVVGGYKNEGYNSKDKVGKLSDTTQLIQVITWDKNQKAYVPVWNNPQSVDTLTAADNRQKLTYNYEMTEPAALTAGQYDIQSTITDIFLEGVTFHYTNAEVVSVNETEKTILKKGSFDRVSNITLYGTTDAWVGTALTGRFLTDSYGSQQTVIVTGDHNSTDAKHGVNLDISWLYKRGGGYTHSMTNNDYLYHRDNGSYGTFLTLCEMPAIETTQYYKYQGKDYGWSAPEVMAVMPSIPYWKELAHNPQDAGGASFRVESGLTRESEGDFHMGFDFEIGGSIQLGAKALNEEAMVGITFNIGMGAEYIYQHVLGTQKTVSQTWTPKAGQDSVLIFAKPIVVYNYQMWNPTHVVTEAEVKKAEELNAMLPDNKKEPFAYKVGDVMDGHFEDMQVSCGYNSVTSAISCEEYNALAEQYSLQKIDMDKILPHAVGDPSTYPSSLDAIPGFPKEGSAKKNTLTSDVVTVSDSAGVQIDFSKSQSSTNANGFDLNAHGTLGSKMSFSVGFLAEAELEFEETGTIHANGGAMFSATTTKGNGISASFASLPDAGYTFNTQMAVWNAKLDGVPAAAGEKKQGPYILGYAVTQLPQPTLPRLPSRPYVYAELSREIILGWDEPLSDGRRPDHYDLYQKKADGSYELVKNGGGIDPSKKYFILYGLNPDTSYNFAFRAVSGTGAESVMGPDITVTTREENTLIFEEPPKNVKVPSGTPAAAFSAKLNAESNAKETLCQWQLLDASGQWTDIAGAKETLTTTQVTSYTDNNARDGSLYRVKATRYYKNTTLPSVSFSKGASVKYSDNGNPDISFGIKDEPEDNVSVYGFTDTRDGVEALLSGTVLIAEPAGGLTPEKFPVPVRVDTSAGPGNNYTWRLNLNPDNSYSFTANEQIIEVPYDKNQREYTLCAEVVAADAGQVLTKSDSQTVKVVVPGQDMYTIAYDLNQGSNAPENPGQIGQEAAGLTLNAPVKKDSAFQGFRLKGSDALFPFTDANQQVTVIDMQDLHNAADANGCVTLEAVWDDAAHTVAYEETNGAANPNPGTYTLYSDTVLEDLVQEGARFTGWYTDAGKTNRVRILPSDLPVEDQGKDITLYAGWEPENYAIDYLMDGGENDPDNPSGYTAADAGTLLKPAKDRMYAMNGREYLAGRYMGWYEDGSDPASASDYTLPAGNFRDLLLRAHYDYGQFFYDPDLPPENRTVEDGDNKAQLAGLLHPDAYFLVLNYDLSSGALDPIYDGLGSGGGIIGGYHIRLLYPANPLDINQAEPVDAAYESPLELSLYLGDVSAYESGSLRLMHITEGDKLVQTPLKEVKGKQRSAGTLYTAKIESLYTPVFAVTGTLKKEPGKPEDPDNPKKEDPKTPGGNENQNQKTGGNARNGASTGDTNHPWMLVLALAGSAAVITAIILVQKKKRRI